MKVWTCFQIGPRFQILSLFFDSVFLWCFLLCLHLWDYSHSCWNCDIFSSCNSRSQRRQDFTCIVLTQLIQLALSICCWGLVGLVCSWSNLVQWVYLFLGFLFVEIDCAPVTVTFWSPFLSPDIILGMNLPESVTVKDKKWHLGFYITRTWLKDIRVRKCVLGDNVVESNWEASCQLSAPKCIPGWRRAESICGSRPRVKLFDSHTV